MQETIDKIVETEKAQNERLQKEKARLAEELVKARDELESAKKDAEKNADTIIKKAIEEAEIKALEDAKSHDAKLDLEIENLRKKSSKNEESAVMFIIEGFKQWQ